MKNRVLARVLLAFLGGLIGAPLSAECSPPHVLHIVTVDASPRIPAGSFEGLPKSLYRLGSKYLRIEEEPDVANGIHGLIVISEPDSWMANLANHTGTHVVDPGPSLVVRAQVFQKDSWPPSFPTAYLNLELGCEQAFFDGFASPVTPFKAADGDHVKQGVGFGDWMLVLLRKDAKSLPETLFLLRHNDVVLMLKYLLYEELPSTDLKLFEKPAGIKFEEAKVESAVPK